MRRPSWNKSQAIQQVLSLKALLEPSDDSGAGGSLRKIVVSPPPPNVPRVSTLRLNDKAHTFLTAKFRLVDGKIGGKWKENNIFGITLKTFFLFL